MGFKKFCGIYLIRNLINQKIYVGGSTNIKCRMSRHRRELNKNKHGNPQLQKDWNEFKYLNFDFSIQEFCTVENLIEIESHWIKFYETLNPEKGYNYFIPDNTSINRPRTSEHNRRASKYVCIKVNTKETKRLSSKEIKTILGFDMDKVSRTSAYWRGSLRVTKTYKGWIFINEIDYKEGFDYVGFDKLRNGRLPVIRRQIKEKVFVPIEERDLGRKPIIMVHCETGEELIFPSITKAVQVFKLTTVKVRKCLYAEFKKYKHHNYYFKFKDYPADPYFKTWMFFRRYNANFVCDKQHSITTESNKFINFGRPMRFDFGHECGSKKFLKYYLDFSAN
jgi:group I intron endonuclease